MNKILFNILRSSLPKCCSYSSINNTLVSAAIFDEGNYISIEFAGICASSGTILWPATMQLSPMTTLSMTVALIPIRQLSPMVQP